MARPLSPIFFRVPHHLRDMPPLPCARPASSSLCVCISTMSHHSFAAARLLAVARQIQRNKPTHSQELGSTRVAALSPARASLSRHPLLQGVAWDHLVCYLRYLL